MNAIADNIVKLKNEIPSDVTLVAVSKTKPPEVILEAYNSGQRIFGENKIQELVYKSECLPDDIQWHMIGHLQSNKVKYIAGYIHLIHSIDSLKLLKEVNKQAIRNNRVINCLLQVKIAREESKFGLNGEQVEDLLQSEEFRDLKNVKIFGLMGMATFTDNEDQLKAEFNFLTNMFNTVKNKYFKEDSQFKEISMGMSDDYLLAINEGATIIRVGSSIFGKRN